LNNNNRNNNRRRGRNNRGGPGGGGNQGNRIDSRARGNAPQMLEKYKKMAHDASLNGDRVQTEYYLQFADHYFRVLADTRVVQKDDQRPRQNEREREEFGDDENEFEDASSRRDRERSDFSDTDEGDDARRGSEGEEASQEDEENPFVRESRPPRSNRSRNGRAGGANGTAEPEAPNAGLDPASLPPSIGAVHELAEDQPRPRRRARKPRPAGDDEALEAVG
jgi:hypothetical protein